MVDSVLKELGRAEAGLASRNRSSLNSISPICVAPNPCWNQATSYDVSTFHPAVLHFLLWRPGLEVSGKGWFIIVGGYAIFDQQKITEHSTIKRRLKAMLMSKRENRDILLPGSASGVARLLLSSGLCNIWSSKQPLKTCLCDIWKHTKLKVALIAQETCIAQSCMA